MTTTSPADSRRATSTAPRVTHLLISTSLSRRRLVHAVDDFWEGEDLLAVGGRGGGRRQTFFRDRCLDEPVFEVETGGMMRSVTPRFEIRVDGMGVAWCDTDALHSLAASTWRLRTDDDVELVGREGWAGAVARRSIPALLFDAGRSVCSMAGSGGGDLDVTFHDADEEAVLTVLEMPSELGHRVGVRIHPAARGWLADWRVAAAVGVAVDGSFGE